MVKTSLGRIHSTVAAYVRLALSGWKPPEAKLVTDGWRMKPIDYVVGWSIVRLG